jgi:aspartate aminotransferase
MKLAKRIAEIEPSITLAITARAKKMKAEGTRVIDFAAGEPDFDSPACVKQAAIQAINSGFTKYTPVSGISELKAAICDKLKKDNGLDYSPDQIVVSCGAKHTLFNIIQVLCQEGDEVIIPSPYWVSYPAMVKLAGAQPVIAKAEASNNFKLNESGLSSSITARTKAVILNSPVNPTGSVYQKNELAKIADIALRRNIFIISDEIYEKIVYDNSRHVSIASLNKKTYQSTIVVNGVSKAYSMTGWRIGYMAGPRRIAEAITALQGHSTSNPASISQKAALAALRNGGQFVKDMQKEFEKRRNYILGGLGKIDKLSFCRPQGAFYLFCNISELGMGSIDFSTQLLAQQKVAVTPGIAFGDDHYVRISFATSMDDIKEGVDRIGRFIKENF